MLVFVTISGMPGQHLKSDRKSMMKRYFGIFVCFLLTVPVFLRAQTAAVIEELLGTEALTYEQAALFVLEAADIPEIYGPAVIYGPGTAFSFAMEKGWLPKNAQNSGRASLQGVSLLIMRAFDIKGGLFYSLLKNPHYAYRELVYLDVIQGRIDPGMSVSGDTLLFLVNRVLSLPEYEQEIAGGETPTPAAAGDEGELHVLAREITAQLEAREISNTTARVTDRGVTISISNIQFLANSAELPEIEKDKLQAIAGILQNIPARNILIAGHTALAGTEQARLVTSLERAQAVADYLVFLGARTQGEISIQGFGSERPIGDNNTAEGMALNRRVEITILENR
jgi:outer membrane protein OmpA-like peptidoglycan-associated protein